jgi:hypothetical protein
MFLLKTSLEKKIGYFGALRVTDIQSLVALNCAKETSTVLGTSSSWPDQNRHFKCMNIGWLTLIRTLWTFAFVNK